MHKYVQTDEGLRVHDGAWDLKGTELNKSVDIYTSGDTPKLLCGYKVWVAPDGMITKGPDALIGKSFAEIASLSEPAKLSIYHSITNALSPTLQASFMDNQLAQATALAHIEDLLETLLEQHEQMEAAE